MNKPTIKAKLGFSKGYWGVRRAGLKVNFKRLKTIFRVRLKVKTFTTDTSAFSYLAKSSLLPVIFALLITTGIYIFERNIHSIATLHYLGSGWINPLLTKRLDVSSYDQLLGTVAAVSGVFLALYFNAVSTVAASVYTKVPSDIRQLVIKDRISNVYVRLVSFVTALSVFLLCLRASGVEPLHLVAPIMVIFAGFTIFSFIRLGQSVFFLSDPTFFAGTLLYKFNQWLDRATVKGWHWQDPNFQEIYRRQAYRVLSTLTALLKISSKQSHLRGESLPKLAQRLIYTVVSYESKKRLIPTTSRWFGQKYKHKQWYLVESTELDMATQTDSALSPNAVPDTNWVEDMLLEPIIDILADDVKNKSFEDLFNKLSYFMNLLEGMGNSWLADEGERWIKKLTDRILKKMIEQKPEPLEVRPGYLEGISDILGSLPLSLTLGFIKAVKDLDISKLGSEIKKCRWQAPGSPYKFNLPTSAIKTLEEVNLGVLFEQQALSNQVTQAWYISEITLNSLDWSLYKQWHGLLDLIEDWFFNAGKSLSGAKLFKPSAAIYSRGLELAWKLGANSDSLKKVTEELRTDIRLDLNRPDWDWSTIEKRIIEFRTKIIEEMAKLIPDLLHEPTDPDTPDYFGEAVHRTGEACYDALREGDADRFKRLFAPYFLGILGTFDRVRPQVADWNPSSALTWLSEPIIDLIDISGYAYIFAEYHSKPELWQSCEEVWAQYLTGARAADQLKLIAALVSHQQHLFAITPRATQRSQRQIDLGNLLNSLPRQNVQHNIYSEPPVEHPSAFIQRIAPRHDIFMFVDAVDVFTVRFLMTQSAANGLDFGISSSKVQEIEDDDEDEEVSDE